LFVDGAERTKAHPAAAENGRAIGRHAGRMTTLTQAEEYLHNGDPHWRQ
jgi:hypothetical protein